MKLTHICMILSALLFFSLTANFFMAGVLVGNKLHPEKTASSENSLRKDRELGQKLSAQDKDIVRRVMQDKKPVFETARQELRAAREEVSRLTADPAENPAALEEALRVEKEKKAALLKLMREARQEMQSVLSAEGKEALKSMRADRLQGLAR